MEQNQLKIKPIFNKIGISILLVLPIAVAVYYALTLPVSFDEASTFLYFTNKGYEASYAHYPAPNNHILHSLITVTTKNIPFLSNLIKLRISSIFFSLISIIILYQFVLKHFNKKMALVVVSISSLLFMNIYYSYMSRGYALVNLFFIITLYCSFNIIKQNNPIKNWIIFGIASILGFYTMPSFLYPFASLNIFILFHNYKNLRAQILVNLMVIIVVVLLYYPIILNDGIQSITNNTYVKPIGFVKTIRSLPIYYLKTIAEISGFSWSILLILLSIALYKIYQFKHKINCSFSFIMVLAPIVLLSLHCVIPFSRVFNYYGVIMILILCLPYQQAINGVSFKVLIPVLLLFQCTLIINFDEKIISYEDKDIALNSAAAIIIPKIIGNKKYYFNGSLLSANLEFELIEQGFKNYYIQKCQPSDVSADSISDFDYIIIKKEHDNTINKEKEFTTEYYNIYKN